MGFRAIRRRLRPLASFLFWRPRTIGKFSWFRTGRLASVPVPTRAELAEIYWLELRDLVDSGELDPGFAQRIVDDVFEPAMEGRPGRELKLSAWNAYVEELRRLAEIRACRRER